MGAAFPEILPLSDLLGGISEVSLKSPVNMLRIIFISGWRTNSIIRSVCSPTLVIACSKLYLCFCLGVWWVFCGFGFFFFDYGLKYKIFLILSATLCPPVPLFQVLSLSLSLCVYPLL